MKPYLVDKPVRLEIDFMQALAAEIASDIPGVERLSGRSIAYVGKDMLDVLKIFRLAGNAALGPFYI